MAIEVLDPISIVPLECRKTLKRLRYHDVAQQDQQLWLEERFFRPADVPGTGGMAGVESVRRVRQVCWSAIEYLETARIRTKYATMVKQPQSKPIIWRVRDHALQSIVHEPGSDLPNHWKWPLVLCAVEGELFPGEALWCLTRVGVLPPILSRLCGLSLLRMAATVTAADFGDFPRRVDGVFRMTTVVGPYQDGLVEHLEQTLQAVSAVRSQIILAAKALFEVDITMSLRHTMGLVAAICQTNIPTILMLQRQMLSTLKYQIAFGDPTDPK